MQKLKIILFRDGRPGHEKQSRGVIKALEKYVELDLTEVKVESQSVLKDGLDYLRFFTTCLSPNRFCPHADLILGTGSSTHIPMLSCKRSGEAIVVVCMNPSRILRKKFDLCFVPHHDRVKKASNILMTVGPPNMSDVSSSHDMEKGLILIGGENSATRPWKAEQVVSHLRKVFELSCIKEWTISTSPRTPASLGNKLLSVSQDFKNINFLSFKETKPGWIDRQYSINKTVWVTGDSMSMVYEALSAGCNVGILPVEWKNERNKYNYSIQFLKSQNRIITFDQMVEGDTGCVNPSPLVEAENCAKEILRRWWPKNLR